MLCPFWRVGTYFEDAVYTNWDLSQLWKCTVWFFAFARNMAATQNKIRQFEIPTVEIFQLQASVVSYTTVEQVVIGDAEFAEQVVHRILAGGGSSSDRVRLEWVNKGWITLVTLPAQLGDARPVQAGPRRGWTLLIQHESPGKDIEANLLPAPKGPFSMILRLYLPKADGLNKQWIQPPLKRVQ
jgi:hypothetical protein